MGDHQLPYRVMSGELIDGSKSRSTIGEGGDTTIPSPGRSPK